MWKTSSKPMVRNRRVMSYLGETRVGLKPNKSRALIESLARMPREVLSMPSVQVRSTNTDLKRLSRYISAKKSSTAAHRFTRTSPTNFIKYMPSRSATRMRPLN